ncbi:MAG TPA: hypothetical protein VNR20_04475 [Terriglobales bacterium]|nr:hypothetical protein [Terriglobales bacterium]
MPIEHDSAPVTAYFRDREAAELCLRELRQSGILNEQIGVAYADATVISPANYAGVLRATDQRNSTSEIEDDRHEDVGTESLPGQPTPNTAKFDSEWEAREYLHPDHGVMVSVSVEPIRRDEIRQVLQHYGARLADWPTAA